ncbi:hypothetical protein GGQ79_000701 [Ochrobactrum pecoris]|uniref:Uncharacterized protein n=1 Tax=Brucella pecoris TaxID=867683 RepID=A0AB34YR96_9HYPH|nr:hypothetical protein [Brucella pecoris]
MTIAARRVTIMDIDPTGQDIGTVIVAIVIIAMAIVAITTGGGIHWRRLAQVRSLAAR